jgi:uncharacterized protein YggE
MILFARRLPAIVLAGGVALATPSMAQPESPGLAPPRTLSMGGVGEVKATPDAAQISAGVTTSAPTAAAAATANNARMQAVFTAIRKLGIPERDIQTVNYSIAPQYTNGGANAAPRLTGYQVSNEVSVRLEDTAKLGGALDALVTAGANQMNGVSFYIKNTTPILAEARTKAVADARAKAEAYAKAAGVALGPILTISENGFSAPRPMMRMAAMAEFAPAPPPVAPGEQTLSANVSIVWEIR